MIDYAAAANMAEDNRREKIAAEKLVIEETTSKAIVPASSIFSDQGITLKLSSILILVKLGLQ